MKATLDEAILAHFESTLYSSSLGDPREVVDVGPLRVVRDAPGRKRDPRRETILIHGVDPAAALKTVSDYKPKHWALAVVEAADADHDGLKQTYKTAGYRQITRFPFFAFDLDAKISSPKGISVERVLSKEHGEIIRRASGWGKIPRGLLDDGDTRMRLYAVFAGNKALGWVQSIRATRDLAWVSGLYVIESARGKGLGRAIMRRMLIDDKKYGAKSSILLASNDGSKLYRRLGYEELGLMQIFTPVRR